ncbi:N-acetylgalactosamine-6-sulfatase [Haloferula helveola]|uniref:N-acetylgalactosamine-6-sulfatase n=1 Tax=Haloferula helveola TaxID=490095 RepID=A0ABN6H2W4_9BACT|nr:N-acetylgalactosamine-6-sulfatase [Haloferula helveola]
MRLLTIFYLACLHLAAAAERPNVVLLMADDLGWGDVGFNGGKIIETPSLDAMAESGMVFERFYSAAPVCSPTRGSCLTGRHPFRYGVYFANKGHLRAPEITLPELLGKLGYATGHFGKWHLGTLSAEFSGKGKGRAPEKNHMTPGMAGFDQWFSTEYSVATWDPYDPKNKHGGGEYDTRRLFWHNGENVTEPQKGDSARIVMDRAVPFIEKAVKAEKPFFTVIWFHAPHSPVVGGPEYRKRYAEHPVPNQHYYACVTAMDEQIGRLRKTLRDLGVADNTLVTFCSDNGPARQGDAEHVGSPGPFRGFKTTLWEGGVRVPAVIEWPGKIEAGSRTKSTAVTSDYLPTLLDIVDLPVPEDRPIDGISLLSVFEGNDAPRSEPIGFQSSRQRVWMDGDLKLITTNDGKKWELYDLGKDPSEKTDIAAEHPEKVKAMTEALDDWRASCKHSDQGGDYPKAEKAGGE